MIHELNELEQKGTFGWQIYRGQPHTLAVPEHTLMGCFTFPGTADIFVFVLEHLAVLLLRNSSG